MLVDAVEGLHERLRDYLEATYHIADPQLLRQRRRILDEVGGLRQPAFIESTRVYAKGRPFGQLLSRFTELERQLIGDLFGRLSQREPPLLHDPPYEHQLAAAEALLGEKNVVVFTGTGSGKT